MESDWTRRRYSAPAKHSKKPSRWSWLLAIACGLLLPFGQAAALPDNFLARYEVNHGSLTLGEAIVNFQKLPGARYRYSTTTRPTGITKLFYNSTITETSEGQITVDGFRPDRYIYDREGRKSRQAHLSFDWKAQTVENDVAGQAWKMDIPRDALDRLVSQLQLMHDLSVQEPRLNYDVADGGQLKTYHLSTLGRESIRTELGTLDTVKVVRKRDDNKRSTTFWCAPSLDYLPVRIEHREKGDEFEMTLESVEGFPAPAPDQGRGSVTPSWP